MFISKLRRLLFRALTFVMVAVCLGTAPLKAAGPEKPIAAFEDLMAYVAHIKSHALPENRLLIKIKNGGLEFKLNDEQMRQVRAAGASKKVQDALLPFVEVPPPPKPVGVLTVLCEPVDCTVSLDNNKDPRLSNISEKGKAVFKLAPGTYDVRATAPDYDPDRAKQSASIQDNAEQTVAFKFQPTKVALREAGKKLYGQVVSALGGDGVLKDSTSFRANGSITLSDRDGKQSHFSFLTFYKAPDTARFVLKRANVTYNVLYTGRDGYKWDKPPADAAALEDVLLQTCRYQIANMLRQLGPPKFEIVSTRVAPLQGTDAMLRAEGSPDTYAIDVDHEFHVKEIKVESQGLNNGLRVLYGDYTGQANQAFAGITQIMLPDGPKHGVDVGYTSVTYHPADMTGDVFAYKAGKRGQIAFVLQY